MEVKIEVGQPLRVEKDTLGPAYNTYPVRVVAPGKGIIRSTLSVNGSQVAESPNGNLNHVLSGRDFPAGPHKLFASAWDGTKTVTTELSHTVAAAAATAEKTATNTAAAASSAPSK